VGPVTAGGAAPDLSERSKSGHARIACGRNAREPADALGQPLQQLARDPWPESPLGPARFEAHRDQVADGAILGDGPRQLEPERAVVLPVADAPVAV